MAVTHFQISEMHAKRSEVFVNVDEKSTDLKLSKFGFRSGFNSSMLRVALGCHDHTRYRRGDGHCDGGVVGHGHTQINKFVNTDLPSWNIVSCMKLSV